MLKQRARALAGGLLLSDLALTAFSLVLAHGLRGGLLRSLWPSVFWAPLYPLSHCGTLLAIILPVWTVCLFSVGFYQSRRTLPLWEEIWAAAKAVFFGTAILAMAVFAFRRVDVSRPFLFLFAFVDFSLLSAEKLMIRALARKARAQGFNFRTVVLAGTAAKAQALGEFLENHPHLGDRVLGYLDDGSGGGVAAGGRREKTREPSSLRHRPPRQTH